MATHGGTTDFAKVVSVCARLGPYCLIGGLAVNCYIEPHFTLDADFVLLASKHPQLKTELVDMGFKVEEFPHSLNATAPNSELRIQFTSDPRYQGFLDRALERPVLGISVRVAALEDIVRGKIWAWQDPKRRFSKRRKDELDLLRIGEAHPEMRRLYPPELLERLKP